MTVGSLLRSSPRKRGPSSWPSSRPLGPASAGTNGVGSILLRITRSLRLHTGELDHLAPLLGFGGDELAEIGGRTWEHRGAQVGKLNNEINAALADAKKKAGLADLGTTVLPGSPADFGKLIAAETEKSGKVVKFAGIKPD